MRADTAKSAAWGAISGIANVAALAFAPASYPGWSFTLVAVGYGLLLPLLAVLQVRHRPVRDSGSILGTAAGLATVTVGIAASANADLAVPALFVHGMWWWTIGKIWAETGILPRSLGIATMVLAVIALGVAVVSAPLAMATATIWVSERAALGVWTLGLSFALWRAR
ncbi:MAG TPA: hypothetical protein VFC31_11125 [Candidatus Limnocylindria bacterium]|nr:hypothetical protein [Candidatus Limnocylindria bacterium]